MAGGGNLQPVQSTLQTLVQTGNIGADAEAVLIQLLSELCCEVGCGCHGNTLPCESNDPAYVKTRAYQLSVVTKHRAAGKHSLASAPAQQFRVRNSISWFIA